MDTGLIITIVIAIALLLILLSYYFIKWRMESKYRHWLEVEQQVLEQERGRIRKEAVIQSRAVLGGKFVEQLTPYLPQFTYDPTEARFIGSPCQLTPQERKIRQLIEDGMVRWELIEQPGQAEE